MDLKNILYLILACALCSCASSDINSPSARKPGDVYFEQQNKQESRDFNSDQANAIINKNQKTKKKRERKKEKKRQETNEQLQKLNVSKKTKQKKAPSFDF